MRELIHELAIALIEQDTQEEIESAFHLFGSDWESKLEDLRKQAKLLRTQTDVELTNESILQSVENIVEQKLA